MPPLRSTGALLRLSSAALLDCDASPTCLRMLLGRQVALLRSGQRTPEDFDMRMLTSGIYIYGLRAWW